MRIQSLHRTKRNFKKWKDQNQDCWEKILKKVWQSDKHKTFAFIDQKNSLFTGLQSHKETNLIIEN